MEVQQQLDNKIERFYRKYYFKKFLLYFFTGVSLLSAFLLCLFALAYFVGFESGQRKFLFFLWVGGASALFVGLLLPLLSMFNVFGRMEYQGLTRLLNRYIPNLEDRLINVMELKQAYADSPNSLIKASLEQKSNQILPLPILTIPLLAFPRKQFLYLLGILTLASVLLFSSPNFYERGALPIMDYNREIKIEAPYDVDFLNTDFSVRKGEDFELHIKVKGDFLPSEMQVHFAGNEFYMQQKSKSEFVYSFKKVNSSFDFYLSGYRYRSDLLKLKALPVPVVMQLETTIDYPAHTKLPTETFTGKGDFQVPEGTKINWNVNLANTDSLLFLVDSTRTYGQVTDNQYTCDYRFLRNTQYAFIPKNAYFSGDSAMQYSIKVIPDEFPAIEVNQIADTLQLGVYYFNGMLTDDYGFRSLRFHLEYDSAGVTQKQNYKLPLNRNLTQSEFFHLFDFRSIGQKGANIRYHFSITDNDGVNGGKTSQSQTFNLLIPSVEEISRLSTEQREAAVKEMEESLKLAKTLKEDIAKLNQALKTEKLTNWEKKEMLSNIKEKQEKLQKMLDEQRKTENELMQMQKNFGDEMSKEMLDKQEEINKLAEQLLDDELKQMLDELQKMQEETDEKKMDEMSDKLDMSMKELEKQLDRNLEMLKRFEVEEKLDGLQYEMDKLAKEQKKLAEQNESKKDKKKHKDAANSDQKKENQESKNDSKSKESSEKEKQKSANDKSQDKKLSNEQKAEAQKEISKKLDEIKKEYEKLLQKNKELKQPTSLDSMKQEFNKAQEQQKDLNDQQQEQKPSKSSKKQKEAAEQMEQMAQQMQKMQQKMQDDMMEVNEDEMRQLMDNLVWYSLEQEELMKMLGTLSPKDPRYGQFTGRQKQLHDNFALVNDSLYALAERSAQIKKPIFDQLKVIAYQQHVIEDNFQDRKLDKIIVAQQRITTAANELALLFDEVLDQMQNMPSGSGAGKKQKSKKKKKGEQKPGDMPNLRKQQEALKKQLQQMMDQMKSGKMGKKQLSKGLAKMLGKQQTIQSKLQQLMQKGKLTPKEQRVLNEINKLSEDVQQDIMNKRITPQLMQRQQKILSRMLEAEKSMQERDKEKKREAKENRITYKKPEQMFTKPEYKKDAFPAIMRKQSIELKQYYKGVYNNYLKELEQNGN